MQKIFGGVITALVTPFKTSGAVDFDAMDRLVERQIDAGVDGLALLVSTGEWPTVRDHEAMQIVSRVVSRIDGRIKAIAGLGSHDTSQTLEAARRTADLGLDGFLVTCPYYNKPTQTGLYDHHMRLADVTGAPLLLYNIAGRSGVNIESDTIFRLARHEMIVGVKESSGDLEQVMDVIAGAPPRFSVLAGDDSMAFAMIALGGDGVVSTVGNLVPADVVAMFKAICKRDLVTARAIHQRLLPLARGCMMEANPIPLKTALAWLGLIDEVFRLPMTNMQAPNKSRWRDILNSHGIELCA